MEFRFDLTRPAPQPAAPPQGAAPAGALAAAEVPAPRKLDLSGMAPPMKLGEARLEDLTIDGICGVY